jgi:topoisomerase IV subunit A
MADLKEQMRHNYLEYASYVILERAIPNVVDGLKPVQRRLLHVLGKMDDGKLHKVANVVGQTMAYHPHGDAPIGEALVNLAMKGYLLDTQGNFGNIYTGDPAAAARYIETRLSELARSTLFNKDLTETLPSYDGRNQEPVSLPAKIPLLLMQGAEGIAVGMSTRILPHNFVELLESEIAILEDRPFTLLPDFPTGGIMDAADYDKGRGKVRLRAKLTVVDEKTIRIDEICYGTTTESLIRSIDEAAKRGKIKIDSINDYTASHVEIEVKLPRGQYANKVVEALYAFTDCQVSLNSIPLVIKDNLPWESDVDEMLRYHAGLLQGYLKQELEIEEGRLIEKIFLKTLEQIFIENRLYKKIEEVKSLEKIHDAIHKALLPFHDQLAREPEQEDRDHLLSIPIRRISRFDIDKNEQEIAELESRLSEVRSNLKGVKKFTIRYLKEILKEYGKAFPRRTQIETIEVIDRRKMEMKQLKVGFDAKSGFIGTAVESESFIDCTNLDKLLLLFKDGAYQVVNIPEKQYVDHEKSPLIFFGVADKKTVLRCLYRDPATNYCYAKRFVITQWILDRIYRFIEEGMVLEVLTSDEGRQVQIEFEPKAKQKVSKLHYDLDEVAIKGVAAKGIRVASKEVKKVRLVSASSSKN